MPLPDLFTALADPTRREILGLLRSRDHTAGEIADHFPQAPSTLSGHLNVLREAGLIVRERQGTRLVYSIHQSALEEALELALRLLGPRPPSGERP